MEVKGGLTGGDAERSRRGGVGKVKDKRGARK